MSRAFNIDQTEIEKIREEFLKFLAAGVFKNNTVNYSKKLTLNTGKKASLEISQLADKKMRALVDKFDKEVAWHGIARKVKDGDYVIDDIVVYPQKVTGSTVTTDQEKYQMWLYEQPDEIFNNLRMQGHSHVNMSVTPSSVDETYYGGIVDQLRDDDFYIFLVTNKKGDVYVNIYDKQSNTVYEDKDVTVFVDVEEEILEFAEKAKELVVDEYFPRYTGTQVYSLKGTLAETKTIGKGKGGKKSKYSDYYAAMTDEEYEAWINERFGCGW